MEEIPGVCIINFLSNSIKRITLLRLYLPSIEKLTENKWLLGFLVVWTKIAICLTPIYLGSAVKFLLFDEAHLTVKVAVFRRMIAFWSFLFKNIFFYLYRNNIEASIDLWDSFFKEEFYSEDRERKLMESQRRNNIILTLSWILTLMASLIYTVPPFFSKTKVLSHPSGIPYRQQSPDYELMVIFDFFRVVMACLSAVALDCILMVFLSHVLVQLTHLRETLAELLDEISWDERGIVTCGGQEITSVGREMSRDFVEMGRIREKMGEIEEKMRIWVVHHQQVIRFFENVKSLFNVIGSLQLVYVVFYTCFTAFHLARAKPGLDAFVIPFIAASNLISLYIWCDLGFQVDLTNSRIFTDAFSRTWFLYPKKLQRVFSIILLRGARPLILRGLSLFDLNLFTFFQVLRITYQLFAFLLQVAREE